MIKMTQIDRFYEEYTKGEAPREKNTIEKIHFALRKFDMDRITLASKLLPSKSEVIMDYGCSMGNFLKLNQKKYSKGIGVDISTKAIKKAENNLPTKKHEFLKGNTDEERLKIKNNSIDTINCSDTIEHVFDPERMIKEFHRILKPGGIVIIITPNIAFLKYRLDLLFGKRPRTSYAIGWDGGHISYFTFKDMEKLLKKYGFKVVKKTTGGIFYQLRTWWPELLGGNIAIVAKKVK